MNMKWLSKGQIVGHDTDRHQVFVEVNGQRRGTPVQVLTPFVNGIQAEQQPLPNIGTWCALGFLDGDDRNPVLLGCYPPGLVDAYNGGSPFEHYTAHFSGVRTLIGEDGSMYLYRPDGTYILIGATSTPTLYKHIVDNSETRQRVALTSSDDPTATTGPITIHHYSNSEIIMDTSGNITLHVGNGKTLNLVQYNGTPQAPSYSTANDALALAKQVAAAFKKHKDDFDTHTHLSSGAGLPTSSMTSIDSTQIASALTSIDGKTQSTTPI